MKSNAFSQQSEFRNTSVCLLLSALSLSIHVIGCTEQRGSLLPQPAPERLIEVNGATLDQIPLEQGNMVYLQTIDLHKMEIDQLIGDIDGRKGVKGLYYPSKNEDSRPFFSFFPIHPPATRFIRVVLEIWRSHNIPKRASPVQSKQT
jgi:hypothetical protein